MVRFVADLPAWRPRFYARSVHMSFVADELELGQLLPQVLRFSPVDIFPPMLRTCLHLNARCYQRLTLQMKQSL